MVTFATLTTKAFGDGVTDEDWNDAAQALNDGVISQTCSAQVHRTGDKSITSATDTAIDFDVEDRNTDGMFNSGDDTKLTIVTAGVYIVWAGLIWDPSAAGSFRRVSIKLNGTTVIAEDESDYLSAGSVTPVSCTTGPYPFDEGDYVEVIARHDVGSALHANSVAAVGNYFRAIRV